MKRNVKLTLAIISIFLIASEFSMVFLFRRLSYSWLWLATFIIKCFTLSYFRIILLVDSQNTIKPMAMIPFIGLIGSFVAFLPIIGMFTHWILFFLMVFFIFVVLNAPTYILIKILKLFIHNTKDDKNN